MKCHRLGASDPITRETIEAARARMLPPAAFKAMCNARERAWNEPSGALLLQ